MKRPCEKKSVDCGKPENGWGTTGQQLLPNKTLLARTPAFIQILNSKQFNGAGRKVLRQFVAEIVEPSGGDLYLSARKENRVACRFYERQGMKVAAPWLGSGRHSPQNTNERVSASAAVAISNSIGSSLIFRIRLQPPGSPKCSVYVHAAPSLIPPS